MARVYTRPATPNTAIQRFVKRKKIATLADIYHYCMNREYSTEQVDSAIAELVDAGKITCILESEKSYLRTYKSN